MPNIGPTPNLEVFMLNAIIATTTPPTVLISLDPRTMRQAHFKRHATLSVRSSGNETEATERDPFSLASPFCNPEF